MSEQLELIVMPDVETNYDPVFTEEQCLLGYKHHANPRGGFGFLDEDERNQIYHSYSIKIPLENPLTITTESDLYGTSTPPLVHVIEIVNGWLKNKRNEKDYPEAHAWIMKNAKQISQDIRYWLMKQLESEVKEQEEKLQRMKASLNVRKYEVNLRRSLSKEERQRVWVEFGGILPN